MNKVQTYVFLDLEVTGLPQEEHNKTKITEICLVAVKRNHLLDTKPGTVPRIINKLTLCLNPGKLISPVSSEITGLCNFLLEREPYFNNSVFETINSFMNLLTPPICLVAHNGDDFDFPILKSHLEKLNQSFSSDILCADSLRAFYNILEKTSDGYVTPTNPQNGTDELLRKDLIEEFFNSNTISMKNINETTPQQKKTTSSYSHVKKAKKKLFFDGNKPKHSYKLGDVYTRLLKTNPGLGHHAENDCIIALKCCIAISKDFAQWVDENHVLFSNIKPMSIGVPIGSQH